MTRQLPTDPDCPHDKHHTLRAARDGCTCLGPGQDAFAAWKERQAEAKRKSDRTVVRSRIAFRAPEDFRADELDRQLRARTDLACRDYDPEMFYIEGDERTRANQRRIEAAREVCLSCPAMLLCREASLQHYDPWPVKGGLSPMERENERAGLRGAPSRTAVADRRAEYNRHNAARRAERQAAREQVPVPVTGADPNVVHAFTAGRLLWVRTTERDRMLLVATLREKGWAVHTVANRLGVRTSFLRQYWEAVAA